MRQLVVTEVETKLLHLLRWSRCFPGWIVSRLLPARSGRSIRWSGGALRLWTDW